MRRGRAQCLLVYHRETVNSRMNQEAFESAHASAGQRLDISLIVANHSTPRSPIDKTLTVCCYPFRLKSLNICRRGQAIERHIHQHRASARGRCTGCSFESLPFSAPGRIDVNVGIDESRQDRGRSDIVHLCLKWDLARIYNATNSFAIHKQRTGTYAICGNQSL